MTRLLFEPIMAPHGGAGWWASRTQPTLREQANKKPRSLAAFVALEVNWSTGTTPGHQARAKAPQPSDHGRHLRAKSPTGRKAAAARQHTGSGCAHQCARVGRSCCGTSSRMAVRLRVQKMPEPHVRTIRQIGQCKSPSPTVKFALKPGRNRFRASPTETANIPAVFLHLDTLPVRS